MYKGIVSPGKKIIYSDHDWDKDRNRTLAITTYQLIQRKMDKEEYINQLNGIPLSRSQLSGEGISVVKMSFFQKEGAFRHLNETFFIMSKFSKHFTVNQMLLKLSLQSMVEATSGQGTN